MSGVAGGGKKGKGQRDGRKRSMRNPSIQDLEKKIEHEKKTLRKGDTLRGNKGI